MFWTNGNIWVGQWSDDEWVSGHKYAAELVPPEVYETRDRDFSLTSKSDSMSMDKAKSKCEELGFEPFVVFPFNTEKFWECVMNLMEMN